MAETDDASCPACAEATANRWSGGAYRADCQECGARALSHSPEYFEGQRTGKMTPAYRQSLVHLFGDEWQAGHYSVKAWAQMRAEQ